MSEHNEDGFGFLRTCIDKRFVADTRREFEWAASLTPTHYWHEAYAGGSALPPANTNGEDYAVSHGATIFGWQAHIDGCGGQPGVSNQQIEQRLDQTISEKLKQYPRGRHFRILASDRGIDIREVSPR